MPPPQLIIFDCDGVLVDSERISHEVLLAMLQEFGVSMTLDQALDRFMGTSMQRCLELVGQLLGGAPPAGFLDNFRQRSFEAFNAQLVPVPGIVELLDALTLPCCVASNGPRAKMLLTLGKTGLLPRFTGRLFSADDVARPKPAPDLFLHAAASLQAQPGACVVVEDSPTGVAAAKAAGMVVFGYAGMTPARRLVEAGADAVFASMSALQPLLMPDQPPT